MKTQRAILLTAACLLLPQVHAQTDWPTYGHDPGAMRFSPLKQINTKNVTRLKEAWTFDTMAGAPELPPPVLRGRGAPIPPPEGDASGPPPGRGRGGRGGPGGAISRARRAEMTPLVVNGVMYLGTAYNQIVALEPETGKKLWEYTGPHNPSERGISYWPGDKEFPPQIVFASMDGWLLSLNAKTGKLVPGFGQEGMVNLRPGVADKFMNNSYGLSSPVALYKNVVVTGAHTQEAPVLGPSGDVRGWDMRTGKLLWTFHTIPRPGEPNHDVWQGDQWVDRSGANAWGLITVDEQRGMLFVPIGAPTVDFYGGDRKGSNLYGSTLVALDALTGKVKWHFQTTHHDNWDYDLQAAPVLFDVKRNGKKIPAVAQSTKQALLFILNRETGEPIFGVEERPVLNDNPNPGDENWPTQPFPIKPPPLARNSFKPEEVAKVTPEHEKYCKDLLALEGGVMTGGPYAQYGPKLRVIFPSWIGGGNWGGAAFNPDLGYLFVNMQSLANLNKMVSRDGVRYNRVGPENAPTNLGGMFWDGNKIWPCQEPPWGELLAVNVNTGDIAWHVPLGSFAELDALGVPKTGQPNKGGPIATAGGLVFIGATIDKKFRAFEAATGKTLWETEMNAGGHAVPITYQGKNGKQYVAIMASGTHTSQPASPGKLYVYSLP